MNEYINIVNPLSFTVITDVHYYSKKNGTEGGAYEKQNTKSQILIKDNEEVIRAAFEQIAQDKETDIVLVSGDVTYNGEMDSHREIIELLRELKKAGKRVYVITATHDYKDNGLTAGFSGDEKITVPAAKREQLFDMYFEFGANEAISIHRESMSYVVKLCDGYRLFALNDDSNGQGRSGFSEDCFSWITQQVKEAQQAGDAVIAMTHHPLLPPSDFYALIGKNDMMGDSARRIEQLADMGVNFIITGHTHVHDISYRFSEKGNVFYDVATSSLVGYPGLMRKLTLDPMAQKLTVHSLPIEIEPKISFNGQNLNEHFENQFFGMIRRVLEYAATDSEKFADIAVSFSVKRETSRKYRFIIKLVARWLRGLKIKTAARWTRRRTGLKKSDYASIADEKVFDFIISLVMSLYKGDAAYSPDTAYYKITVGVAQKLDAILKLFGQSADKIIKGAQSIEAMVKPLLYNSGICDSDAELLLDKKETLD